MHQQVPHQMTQAFLLACLVLGMGNFALGQDEASMVVKVKAAYLYSFPKFVTWGEQKIGQSKAPIVLGILGGAEGIQMKGLLDTVVDDRGLIQDHPLQVVVLNYVPPEEKSEKDRQNFQKQIQACHLLYISGTNPQQLQDLLGITRGHQVLTVGSGASFIGQGGMVGLVLKEASIIFQVNMPAVTDENLVISPKLLRRAELIQ